MARGRGPHADLQLSSSSTSLPWMHTRRIVTVETRMLDVAGDDRGTGQLIRYQLGNHVGSAVLELADIYQHATSNRDREIAAAIDARIGRDGDS